MDVPILVNQQRLTPISHIWILVAGGREGKRESGNSVLSVRLDNKDDDDDDDDILFFVTFQIIEYTFFLALK